MGSKADCKPIQGARNSPSAKLNLNWDTSAMEVAEETGSARKRYRWRLVSSPIGNNEDHKMEHLGFEEYLDAPSNKRYSLMS